MKVRPIHRLALSRTFSFVPHEFTLHHMMQPQQHHGSQLFFCLLDLKGAYDCVSRPLPWQALKCLGVHATMLSAVLAMYAKCKCVHMGRWQVAQDKANP